MRCAVLLVVFAVVHAAKERDAKLARDMQYSAIEVTAEGDNVEESSESDSGPVDDIPCLDKLKVCMDKCVYMLEYYITDVAAKFDGLQLVIVPDGQDEDMKKFMEAMTTPLVNEASFLYCGIQRCFSAYCSEECGPNDEEANLEILNRCKEVNAVKLQFLKAQKKKEVCRNVQMIAPTCQSVCGPDEPEVVGEEIVEPGASAAVTMALVLLLLQ